MPPILLCHPITNSPKGCLLAVPLLFHVHACTGMCLLKQATSQHKYRLTISSAVIREDETAEWCRSSALSLITCWYRCLWVAYVLIFLPPLGDPGSRSVVKTSWELGAHTWRSAACASTTSAWRAARPPTHACTCTHSLTVSRVLTHNWVSPQTQWWYYYHLLLSVCAHVWINPSFLSSTTEIWYQVVITTQKCAQLHRENICSIKK